MNNAERDLCLDRRRSLFLGVCAGFGKYFGIEPWLIRIALLVAIFTWVPTILVYFVCYFLMNKDGNSIGEIKSTLSNSKVGRHLKNIDYKKRLYKSTRNKRIAGVCSGLADYFEINAFFIRLAFIGSLFFGPFAIFAYIAAAILMDRDPNAADESNCGRRYTHRRMDRHMRETVNDNIQAAKEYAYQKKKKMFEDARAANAEPPFNKNDMDKCVKRFSELEMKLRRLEATITSKKFKLHSEIKRMSGDSPA